MFKRVIIGISSLLLIFSWTPDALALVPIKLTDLSYHECPAEPDSGSFTTSDGSGNAANCYIVTGTAVNKSRKTVYDADIRGRIYDANDNDVLPNRTRLGSIDEVPAGESKFEMQISVPANLATPLKLKQFKASGSRNPVSLHF
ncbi:MAG: FxLYD domain-containing protein [Hormoscilla sp.]